jgi:NAD(P)-dependent dehydrogenase (short-subunit alcohol dehydrogenase family)
MTGSESHRRASIDFENLQFERDYDALQAYSRSKLALSAFTLELADCVAEDVTANSFHSGFVPSTNLFRDTALTTRLPVRIAGIVLGVGTSERAGGQQLVHLATAPEFGDRTGVYVTGDGVVHPSDEAVDLEIRARLWYRSADLVGVNPP